MKNYFTKFAAISMAAMMAVSMTGCSINITTTDNKKEDTQKEETIDHEAYEVAQDVMVAGTGIDLPLPEEASDIKYSIIGMPDWDIAQAEFTLDGDKMYLRACFTNLTTLNDQPVDAVSFDTEAGNISGMDYKWNSFRMTDVQGREATTSATKKGQGYIAWLDVVPGILYNLCMEENADMDKLETLASILFVPMQGEVDGDVGEATEEGSNNYAVIMDEIYHTQAGSAGSSERVKAAAQRLNAYVMDNGEAISFQNQSALAEEMLTNLKNQYGDDCIKNFEECFSAVVAQAILENPDLEGDVAFDNVVNGVIMALGMAE